MPPACCAHLASKVTRHMGLVLLCWPSDAPTSQMYSIQIQWRPTLIALRTVRLQEQTVGVESLLNFLADCALMTAGVEVGAESSADAMRLATLHGSKGLEFDTVFIVGGILTQNLTLP